MSNLPQRKNPRLENYDYSAPGAYFITVCTKDKAKTLCSFVGNAVLSVPECLYTTYGKIVENRLSELSNYYDGIVIDKYVVMPNHVHILMRIENGTLRTAFPTSVPDFIGVFKRMCSREAGASLWQKSFYDHVIRDEADYLRIWEYIDTNPIKWQDDCYYTPEKDNV